MWDMYGGNLVEDANKSLRLSNGLFDELRLYDWIRDKEFYYINATIYGLDNVIDLELFDIIVTQMEFLLLECKDEYLKGRYIEILYNAIRVAGRHPEHYGKYVEQLFYSTYDRIRLCCYANLDLNDTIREQ